MSPKSKHGRCLRGGYIPQARRYSVLSSDMGDEIESVGGTPLLVNLSALPDFSDLSEPLREDFETPIPAAKALPVKWRPFMDRKQKLRKKLERRLRRKPVKEVDSGHEDDNIFESDFSEPSLSSDGVMWTSEAALSTENSDTDRGPQREGALNWEHMLDIDNVIPTRRVEKMMRRINVSDPWINYKNHFDKMPQMGPKPYKFCKKVRMIDSHRSLQNVIDLSRREGYPNITAILYLSYHIMYRQPCKLLAPDFDEFAHKQKPYRANFGVVDCGKYPDLLRAVGATNLPFCTFHARGKKIEEIYGSADCLLRYGLEVAEEFAHPERVPPNEPEPGYPKLYPGDEVFDEDSVDTDYLRRILNGDDDELDNETEEDEIKQKKRKKNQFGESISDDDGDEDANIESRFGRVGAMPPGAPVPGVPIGKVPSLPVDPLENTRESRPKPAPTLVPDKKGNLVRVRPPIKLDSSDDKKNDDLRFEEGLPRPIDTLNMPGMPNLGSRQ